MTQKNILMGCLAVSLLAGAIVACAVGGIFFLGLTGVAEEAEQQGIEFGRQTDQIGCQTEALQRLRTAIRRKGLRHSSAVQYLRHSAHGGQRRCAVKFYECSESAFQRENGELSKIGS